MGAFLIRRFLTLIPLLLGVTFVVFLLMELAPGDFLTPIRAQKDIRPETIAEMEKDFGLNDPWVIRYGLWLKNAAQFKFGYSWSYKMPVAELILERVPATLSIALTSLLFAWVIAIPLGVLAAIYKDSWIDRLTGVLAYAALSIPEFFLALLALVVAAQTGWFPLGGITSIEYDFLPWYEKNRRLFTPLNSSDDCSGIRGNRRDHAVVEGQSFRLLASRICDHCSGKGDAGRGYFISACTPERD